MGVEITFHDQVVVHGGNPVFGVATLRQRVGSPAPASRDDAERMLFAAATPAGSPRVSSWLDPRAGVVAVQHRREVDDLVRWCEGGAGAVARLVCGPGGQGKTVLARQACAAMSRKGWLAGFVEPPPAGWQRHDAGTAATGSAMTHRERWERAVAAVGGAAELADVPGLLLVVDYADAVPHLAGELLSAAAAADSTATPVRVLFLSRHRGQWWTELVADAPTADPQELVLPALPQSMPSGVDGDSTAALWRGAVAAFAAKAAAQGLAPAQAPPMPDLTPGPFPTTLDLYANALLHALKQDAAVPGEPPVPLPAGKDPIRLLLEQHEYRQVGRSLAAAGVDPRQLGDVLTTVFLRPVPDRATGVTVLRTLPALAHLPEPVLWDAVTSLAELYRPESGETIWACPRPDRLTDTHLLLAAERAHSDPEWSAHLLAACGGDDQASGLHAGTVLLRTLSTPGADRHYENGLSRVRKALAALLQAHPGTFLPPVLTGDHGLLFSDQARDLVTDPAATSIALVRQLDEHLSHAETTAQRSVAVAVSQRLVRETPPDLADPEAVARHGQDLTSYSRRLALAGDLAPALRVATGAVALLRPMADPDTHPQPAPAVRAALASALTNLGSRLAEHRQPQQALDATAEAVEIRARLADQDPARYLPQLYAALTNQVLRHLDLDQVDQAGSIAVRAVAALRTLSGATTNEHHLAVALTNHAEVILAGGRPDKAVPVAREAVAILSRLHRRQPFAHRTVLVAAQLCLAACLAPPRGRARRTAATRDAVALAQQAVNSLRELAEKDPTAYRADLATAWLNLATRYGTFGRPLDGVAAAEQAVAARRTLPRHDHDGHYERDLGAALVTHSLLLATARRYEPAIASAREAVEHYRRAADIDADAPARHDLALALNNLAYELTNTGHPDAVRTAVESVDLHRQIRSADTPAFWDLHLADALANCALAYARAGQLPQAVEAQLEAIDLYQLHGDDGLPGAQLRLREAIAQLGRLRTVAASPDRKANTSKLGRYRRHWPLERLSYLLPGIAIGVWSTDLIRHDRGPRTLRDELLAWFDRSRSHTAQAQRPTVEAAPLPELVAGTSAVVSVAAITTAAEPAQAAGLVPRLVERAQNAAARVTSSAMRLPGAPSVLQTAQQYPIVVRAVSGVVV
ncbi:MAG TPA: tetratricopeptide repeat protein, partial [Micromonosporaceae bacterium]|nr:tetratricopeptide repeat protein [Micromonosporaceae bacterium]